MSWTVYLHPDAKAEQAKLPTREQAAINNAIHKLQATGPTLGYPHSSAVKAADHLRELRPRAGRSQWRAFYRQIGDGFVIAAIGPEAEVDPKGFDRATRLAAERLNDIQG